MAEAIFGCIATSNYLPSGEILLEEYFALVGELEMKMRNPTLPHLPIRHPNNLVPPWGTCELLSWQCQEIMSGPTSPFADSYRDPCTISWSIWWQPPNMGIIFMELFVGIGSRLATILKVGLIVWRYIHVDNALVAQKAAKHHINQLIIQFPEQLLESAMEILFF